VNSFGFQDDVSKILGESASVLIYPVVASLIDGCGAVKLTVKGWTDIGASVIETRNVPPVFQR
jgi:hypothetical protein